MTMRLQLAKPADNREGAKVFVEFYTDPACKHVLKLHQDTEGTWWPELDVNVSFGHEDILLVLDEIIENLKEVQQLIQSDDFKGLPALAKMVSKS